jgi:hypothetical protein
MSNPEVIDQRGSTPTDPATGLPVSKRRRAVPAAPSAPTPILTPARAEPRPDATGWRPCTALWEAGLQHGNTSEYRFPDWTPEAVAFVCEHHGKDVEAEVVATLAKLAGNIKADLKTVLGPGLPEHQAPVRARLARALDHYQGWAGILPQVRAALSMGGEQPQPLELPRLFDHLAPKVSDIRAVIGFKIALLRGDPADPGRTARLAKGELDVLELDRLLSETAAVLRGPRAAYYAATTRPGNLSADYMRACEELSKEFYGEAGRDPATFAVTKGTPIVIHGPASWLATGPLEWMIERSTKWLRRRADLLARIERLEDDYAHATQLAAAACARVVEQAGGRDRVFQSAAAALMLRPDDPRRWPRTPTPRSEAERAKEELDGLDRELLVRRDWSAPGVPGMVELERRREAAHASWMTARAAHVASCEAAAASLTDGALSGDEPARAGLEALVRERPQEFPDHFAEALRTAGPESLIFEVLAQL